MARCGRGQKNEGWRARNEAGEVPKRQEEDVSRLVHHR